MPEGVGQTMCRMTRARLAEFRAKWDTRYPLVGRDWEAKWDRFANMFQYTEPVRRIIYTTNAIESLNSQLRKVTKNRPSFPNEQAAEKLLYLAIDRITKKWTRPMKDWGEALNQFAIKFGERLIIN